MQQKRFEGKIAVVTASSTGIGFAIVERLAQEGATVIVSSRNQKHVDHAVSEIQKQGGKADGMVVHASNKDDRTKLFNYVKQKYGGIDILVPNAAVSTFFGPFLDTTEKQMDKMFDVNFKGAFFLIQEALPLMEGRKDANIIVISSYAAYEPANEIGFYSITKTMLSLLTKMASRQLLDEGIRVNAVCPGLIKTNFAKALYDGREEQVIKDLKVQRLGVPSDISNAVAFLASKDAGYVNGEALLVTGKASARL